MTVNKLIAALQALVENKIRVSEADRNHYLCKDQQADDEDMKYMRLYEDEQYKLRLLYQRRAMLSVLK